MKYTLIGPFTQLLPMSGLPFRGALSDNVLPVMEQAGVLIEDENILAVGPYSDLQSQANELGARVYTLEGDHVALPGLVDAHTHICFAGSRAGDYAMRNAGKSYLEIAKAGGGIWDTVTQTRKASQTTLTENVVQRAGEHLKRGVTTTEVKSGYGLTVSEELKMLCAIRDARQETPADLVSTCLAAHMLPKDFKGDAETYLEWISEELFPVLKKENLANRIDAFIEESAFSPEAIAPYFEKAKAMGFDITVHADQFTTGGSKTAVQFNAVSADHLEASTEKEIELLAKSNTIAMALPGASIGLGCAYTPARKLLDAGGILAIASDWNPGSAPMGDLLTQAAILGTFEKLSNTEVLAGIAYRAAAALGMPDRGVLEKGKLADITVFPTADHREILYHQGQLQPHLVWKRGKQIV